MTKKLKPIPRFRSEAQERAFWERNDSTDYVDWSQAKRVRFPNLKPTTTAISLRFPVGMLEQIKIAANKRYMRYQSLIKAWLGEKVGIRRVQPHAGSPLDLLHRHRNGECVLSAAADDTA